jgi:predicted dehydrogenase
LRRNLRIVAGYDPDRDAARRATDRARALRTEGFSAHDSLDALLATPGLDAVIVSSPPHLHAEQSVVAMEAGLHVYAEVPMSLSMAEIEKVISAEASSGKRYQHGENYCFFTEVLYAGHLARTGKLGKPVAATAEFQIDEDPRKEWRARLDPLMYGHAIAPAQVILGGIEAPVPFIEVFSRGNRNALDDGAAAFSPAFTYHEAICSTADGAVARCVNAYMSTRPHGRFRFEVLGASATFECSRPGGTATLSRRISSAAGGHLKISTRVGQLAMSRVVKPSLGNFHGSRTRILLDWADSISIGKKPMLNAVVAASACAAGIAASESARLGRVVRVKPFT